MKTLFNEDKINQVIYDDWIKYHLVNRVFSFREYQEMVYRDPDQLSTVEKRAKQKRNSYV